MNSISVSQKILRDNWEARGFFVCSVEELMELLSQTRNLVDISGLKLYYSSHNSMGLDLHYER